MRYLILIACMLPVIAFGQQKADYERTVANYMKYYNNQQADSIIEQYSDEWGETKKKLSSKEQIQELIEKYGYMKSYKFIELYKPSDGNGGGDGLALFKTVFTKSTHMMAITLSKDNKLLTFRFKTSSPHLDSLLKNN